MTLRRRTFLLVTAAVWGALLLALFVVDALVNQALRGQLFQPFMRLTAGRARTQGGTGLGLAIAREIACVHGGDLTYQDRPGGGARFVAGLADGSP